MKTPKRHHELTTMEHISTERVWDYSQEQVNSQRWKRKNREAQYKHTIAKLTRMLQNTEQCLLATQKMTCFGCFRPSHWENVFVNKEEEEEKKRLKTLKRLIRKLKPNDKP